MFKTILQHNKTQSDLKEDVELKGADKVDYFEFSGEHKEERNSSQGKIHLVCLLTGKTGLSSLIDNSSLSFFSLWKIEQVENEFCPEDP